MRLFIVFLLALAACRPAASGPSGPPPNQLDLGGGEVLPLTLIPGGSIEMKTGDTSQRVTLRPFLMGVTEVTNAQYRRFQPDFGSTDFQKPTYEAAGLDFNGDRQPAIVTWLQAKAYVDWLSKKSGRTVRLPSESEWEYAARAGTRTRFFWGDDPALAPRYANVNDPQTHETLVVGDHAQPQEDRFPGHDPHRHTAPVASYAPNPWGLHDMLGNLMEWCADRQSDDYAGLPADGSPRGGWNAPVGRQDSMVLRGGSYVSGPGLASVDARNYCFASAHFNSTGFRVVVEP